MMDLDELVEATYPMPFTPDMYYRILKSETGRGGYELVIGFADKLTEKDFKLQVKEIRKLKEQVLLRRFGIGPDSLFDVLSASIYYLKMNKGNIDSKIVSMMNQAIHNALLVALYINSLETYPPQLDERRQFLEKLVKDSEYEGAWNRSKISTNIFFFCGLSILFLFPRAKGDSDTKKQKKRDIGETLKEEMRNILNGKPAWKHLPEPVTKDAIWAVINRWDKRVGPKWFDDMNTQGREKTISTILPICSWLSGDLLCPPMWLVDRLVADQELVLFYDGLPTKASDFYLRW